MPDGRPRPPSPIPEILIRELPERLPGEICDLDVAVEEYLLKYRQEHPEFATKNPRPDNVVIERELKKNIQTDIVIIRGVKREVVITEDGWRSLTDDDYEPERVSVPAMSVIDIPK